MDECRHVKEAQSTARRNSASVRLDSRDRVRPKKRRARHAAVQDAETPVGASNRGKGTIGWPRAAGRIDPDSESASIARDSA